MSEIEEEVTVEKTSKKINLRDYLGEDSSEFYQKNKLVINIISGVIGLALLVWGSYTGWDYFYVQPKHKESISFLWQAERDLFDSEEENKTQSILTALNGDSMMTSSPFDRRLKQRLNRHCFAPFETMIWEVL